MSVPEATDNKRRKPRLRTIKGATLFLPHTAAAFSCVMRNLSETGALVELPSTLGIPSHVVLRTNDGMVDRHCTIVWRTETRIGLSFDQPV
jgi:hypothetical protein